MRNVGWSLEGLPPGTELIPGPRVQRQVGGVERTEAKLGIKSGAHDDPITYHRLTK